MLRIKLLHPEILSALASNGHGARILIADGNFPISTATGRQCRKVFLNFSPGMLTVTDVLKVIKDHIPLESYFVMSPPDGTEQAIHKEFNDILGMNIPVSKEKRFEFYKECQSDDTCLAIATGETRRFANILLVMGSIKEADTPA